MKTFVLIGIVGTAAVMAVWVLQQEPPAAPATALTSIDPATATRPTESAVAPVQDPPETRASGVRARTSDPVAIVPAEDEPPEPTPEDLAAPCTCAGAWLARRQEREAAAREAEPKDINWAYETEQLLEQFIIAHPQARAIRLERIDCRTSFCEIDASGQPVSWEPFAEVIGDALKEPWSTLSHTTSMASEFKVDDRQGFRAIVERSSLPAAASATDPLRSQTPDPDEETCECATAQWHMRRGRLEAAARAAELKDVYWAFATEQELQQLISADPRAEMFQVSTIDCRTTYCEIRAIGHMEQSADDFRDIVRHAMAQEQFGFAPRLSTSVSGSDGKYEMGARLTRDR